MVPKRNIKLVDANKLSSASAKVKLNESKKVATEKKKEDIQLSDVKVKDFISKEVCIQPNEKLSTAKEKIIIIEKPPEKRPPAEENVD